MVSFIERHRGGERVLLVHVRFDNGAFAEFDETEFIDLTLSSGAQLIDEIRVVRQAPHPKYCIGVGKAEELAQCVKAEDIDLVICNCALSPSQERNLEALCCCRVLDRAGLILDIFASRARTFEGKLQVELAQLRHISTRLVRGWTHLERQKGGIGLRGPGETQLETDRRLLQQRMTHLKARIKKVISQRALGRRARKRANLHTVSLVGYTNAGKSTLFNRLTGAGVYVEDQLFATLDPTLREINLPIIGHAILADTVGFIQDLPHELIAAFKATLEETREASLLLHVVDSCDPHAQKKMTEVRQVLTDISADTVPALLVYNKIDMSEQSVRVDRDEDGQVWRVWVSAQTGQGMDLLRQVIAECLSEHLLECHWVLAPSQGKLRARLYDLGAVMSEMVQDDGSIALQLNISRQDYETLLPIYRDKS